MTIMRHCFELVTCAMIIDHLAASMPLQAPSMPAKAASMPANYAYFYGIQHFVMAYTPPRSTNLFEYLYTFMYLS